MFAASVFLAACAVCALVLAAPVGRALARLLARPSVWWPWYPDWVIRGPALRSSQESAAELARQRAARADDGTFDLLGCRFPLDAAHLGLLLMGVPGTGKTSVAAEMIASLCRRLYRTGERLRLVIFDAKNEWPAKLHALLPPWVPLYQLSPLDALRGVRWALAEDVQSPAEAFQIATGFTPATANDPNGFFTRAGRNALMDLAIVLVLTAGRRWRPRHLAALSRNRRLLAAVLRAHPVTRDTAGQMIGGKSGKDVLATIGSFINMLLPAFAGWDRCEAAISIKRFLSGNGALVLGWDDGVSDALSPLYTLFLRMLIDQVLLNRDPTDRTFLFLDELGLLGKLDALPRGEYRGRSSALCVAAGVQDVNTLYRIYGPHMAREILANLQTKVFFRLGSRESAELAAGLIGKHEVRRWLQTHSVTNGPQGPSTTIGVQEQVTDRYAVLPDELLHLPLPDPVWDRLTGYALSPFLGGTIGFQVPFLATARALAGDPAFENYRRRLPEEQILAPLTLTEIEEMGLPLTDEIVAALVRFDRRRA